ncbi:uncharacterized protein LOC125382123 [Haliotis rufescens]|uniref:uncharacterized protein LOC125382123 n=1 Tax=Haliotis rufescens TaxID=6454 RepID=UPI00201F400A|nr:uncharacterized protein LOC125382123 [Haliotis rufescens]
MTWVYTSLGFIGAYILLLLFISVVLLFAKRRCERGNSLSDLSFSILDIAAIYQNEGDPIPLRKKKRSRNSDSSSSYSDSDGDSDDHSYEDLGAVRPVSDVTCGATGCEEPIKTVADTTVTGRPQPPKKCSTLSGILLKKIGRGWRKSGNRFKSSYKGALARGSVSSNLTNDYVPVDDSRGDSTASTFETSKMAYLSNTNKADVFVPDEDENMDIVLNRPNPEEGDDVLLRETSDGKTRQSSMSTLLRTSWLNMQPVADVDLGSIYASAGSGVSLEETEGMFIPEEDIAHPILEGAVPNIQEMSQNIIDMISNNFSSKNNIDPFDDQSRSAGQFAMPRLSSKTKTLPLSRNLLEVHPISKETTTTHGTNFGRASRTSQSSGYDELTSINTESLNKQSSDTRGHVNPAGTASLPRLQSKSKTSKLSRNLSDTRRSRHGTPKIDDTFFPPIPRLSDTFENKDKLLGLPEKGVKKEDLSFPPIPKFSKSPGNFKEKDKPSNQPDVTDYPSLPSPRSSGLQSELSTNDTIPIQKRPLPPLPLPDKSQTYHAAPSIPSQPIKSKPADQKFCDRDSSFSDSRGSTSSDDLQSFEGEYQNTGQRPTSSSLKLAGKGGPPPPPPRKDSKLTSQTPAKPKPGPTAINVMAFSQVTKQLQEKLAMRLPGQPMPRKPDPPSSEAGQPMPRKPDPPSSEDDI